MHNILLFTSILALLIPLISFVVNRKYFYYSSLVLYPIIGQLIRVDIDLPIGTINPSMILGFLILALVLIDVATGGFQNGSLLVLVLVFIFYSLMISALSSVRMMSLVWTSKLALWMLTFLGAAKTFKGKEEVQQISRLVMFSSLIVLCSLLLSFFGFIQGDVQSYETGVKSHGAGFSSGKAIGYYLAFAVPILFAKIKIDKSKSPMIYVVLVLALIGIALTFVRAPVVGLFIGLLAYYGYSVIYRDKNMLGTLLIICFFGLSVVAVFLIFRESQYLSRWYELGDRVERGQVKKLGSGRVGLLTTFFHYYLYKASISAKIFGTGLGSSLELLGARKYIHNDFAEILMGLGVTGLVLYLLILYKMFRILLNGVRKSTGRTAKEYSIVGLSYFMIFLSFHMTNLSTGVLYLFLWALFTGAIVGVARNDAGFPAGRPVIGS